MPQAVPAPATWLFCQPEEKVLHAPAPGVVPGPSSQAERVRGQLTCLMKNPEVVAASSVASCTGQDSLQQAVPGKPLRSLGTATGPSSSHPPGETAGEAVSLGECMGQFAETPGTVQYNIWLEYPGYLC